MKANLRHANLSNDEKKSEGEDFAAAEKAEEEEVRRSVFARNYRWGRWLWWLWRRFQYRLVIVMLIVMPLCLQYHIMLMSIAENKNIKCIDKLFLHSSQSGIRRGQRWNIRRRITSLLMPQSKFNWNAYKHVKFTFIFKFHRFSFSPAENEILDGVPELGKHFKLAAAADRNQRNGRKKRKSGGGGLWTFPQNFATHLFQTKVF